MGVARGTWTLRSAVVVAALAIALGALIWTRVVAPAAVSAGSPVAAGPISGEITGDLSAVRSDRPGLRVLFVGNSFTSANAMTTMLARLAAEDTGAEPIFVAEYAPGGSRLEDAARNGNLRQAIREDKWNVVVLQEQSAVPSIRGYREEHMFPAAETLKAMATQRGARTLLYMTWGYKDGDRDDVPTDTYMAMQERLVTGYLDLSARLGTPVAPVGLAWQAALQERPDAPLWAADGRHPSPAGSYLAACVLYARLTGRDPRWSRFTGGLDPALAHELQRIAGTGRRFRRGANFGASGP